MYVKKASSIERDYIVSESVSLNLRCLSFG